MTRPQLVGLVAAVWLLVGSLGTWAYGHDYWVYRGFAPPVDPPGVAPGKLEQISFYSPALRQRRSYDIYLPPGYAAAAAQGTRFRVLYLLHGSPGRPDMFLTSSAAGLRMDTLVARHAIQPYLIVMPNGRDGSYRSDTEWANTAHGRYESLVLDAVHAVDARWPTLPTRQARAIAGNSEGGYAAINVALHHLGTFSVAESWSGYFTQTPTGVFAGATPAQLHSASPAAYVDGMRSSLRRLPFHAFLYSGRQDRGTPQTIAFASALRAAGGHVSTATPPGRHDWRLWRAEMAPMLRFADREMTAR
jgi:enterochelin esterase-like enzyme